MIETDPRLMPRVLYIEDSEEARFLVRRLLQGKYLVLETDDPLDGLSLAEDTHPDLVLIDENLPHMKGSEVATRLRKILPDARLVIISADSVAGTRERALAAGAAGFIGKPIDVDTFAEQVESFLGGKREEVEQLEHHMQVYQEELVERLEGNIRQLTNTLQRNEYLLTQNARMIEMLERRQKLLETAARVGQAVTSILDIDELLMRTVGIICSEFGIYYSGVFLLSEDKQWVELHAGYGDAGKEMLRAEFRLPVDRSSMVGVAILDKKGQLTADVEAQATHFKNPYLKDTSSEIALPLIAKSQVLGALTVQSDQLNAFAEEDVTALQTMADQVAIAINNARLLQELEEANNELVRTKTFEAIATATGEAIHWVGNKAAPIPGSVQRLREDLSNLLAMLALLQNREQAGAGFEALQDAVQNLLSEAGQSGLQLEELASALLTYSPKRLQALLDIESTLEDLQIIEHSAETILHIKEDMIGPARQRNPKSFSLAEMLTMLVANMGLPKGVVETNWPGDLPQAFGDARQIEQVFNNLVKNAWEALDGQADPKIWIEARSASEPDYLLVTIKDNGPGIPAEIQEKIWVSFFTTKGDRGGTGLGLSACMQIVNQNNGKIWLQSEPGEGATFSVFLPSVEKNQLRSS
jgi:signal transduction histidine kinase/DNA-binding NarL/FixJ family response regulator